MTALLALMRKAEGARKPTDADDEILDSLKSLSDDTEEVTAFLHNLVAIDQHRCAMYLVQCQEYLPGLYDEVKTAIEEEPMEDEEEMGEEEMPMEEEGQEEDEMPMEDEGEEEVISVEDEGELPMEDEGELPMEEGQEEDEGELPMEDEGELPMEDEGELPMEDEGELPMEEEGQEEDEEVAVEPVVDQDELETEEATADDLDMVLFQTNAAKGPHWSVFFKGRPLCAIRLADQENPDEIKELFVTEEYPKHVKDACASPIGIRETLNSINAHWYMGVISTGQVASEAREAAAQELEDQFAGRLASLKEDLLNTINLAITASNKGSKGLFVENTLKAACAQVLREAGVAGATAHLNEVWAEAAQTYMQDILRVAEKWLSYSPEAMKEVTAEIVGTEMEIEEDESEIDTPKVQAAARQAVATAAMPQNVPIRTHQSTVQEEDYRQAATQRVASTLSRRMGQRRMGR